MASTEAGTTTESAVLALMSLPDSYPDATSRVTQVDTHLSRVFLTDDCAYKLKKPLKRPFLDLSTLAARERNCRAELRLNRRLAEEVYLAVVPVVRTAEGGLRLGGPGAAVEWTVKMRRLPAAHMLDVAIRRGTADLARLRAVAARLCRFHRQARRVALDGATLRATQRAALAANLAALDGGSYGLDRATLHTTAGQLGAYLLARAEIFDARARQGQIVEGHGDLRPEHVYLGPPPLFIDCLEFSHALRLLDPLEELACLGLECEFVGAAWVGRFVHGVYALECQDPAPASLSAFYGGMRGLLRAKLCAWHVHDLPPAVHAHWLARAARYLALASAHAAHCADALSAQ